MADNSYEEAVLGQYSTPSLRRNQLTRASKKLSMEFDAQAARMTRAERDEFLDRMFGCENSNPVLVVDSEVPQDGEKSD